MAKTIRQRAVKGIRSRGRHRLRGGKTTSRTRQEWNLAKPLEEDRVGWRDIVEMSTVVPKRPCI